ncbi:MAG: DUF418 domain-containing protein [Polyangiaceae bacterium]|nr:DUF418 domain-containing protein [Polyangiaceae bacterium]
METTSNTPSDRTPRPVDTGERIVLLDVIRGFALGGVFFSNVFLWFSGRVLMPPTFWQTPETGVRAAFAHAFRNLVFGKFITIFTFLFGLGLAVQFARADDREDSAALRYSKRAAVMLLFGILHMALVWYGDILHVYALLGFGILLFRRTSTKKLIIIGAILAFCAGPVTMWLESFLPRLWSSPDVLKQAMQAKQAHFTTVNEQARTLFLSGSYGSNVRANLLTYWHHFARLHVIGFYLGMFGNFLLGYAAGKAAVFTNVDKYRRLFRHLVGWGLLGGIIGGAGFAFLRMVGPGKQYFVTNQTLVPLFVPIARELQTLGLAAFYMATITLLFQRPLWRRILSIYAPVGRTAVTNYLSQSVVAVFVFTGIGLGHLGNLSPIWTVGMPLGVFIVQMVISRLWLSRFAFGPVEWVWRSMTYGKVQPLRRANESVGEIADEPQGDVAAASSGSA